MKQNNCMNRSTRPLTLLNREGKTCWIRVYSLPTDRSRPETSLCLDYPGRKELAKLDKEVDLLEELDYSKYGLHFLSYVRITHKQ